MKVPHVGFNEVVKSGPSKLLKDMGDHSDFYFVHSYCFTCKGQSHIYGKTDYGGLFTSIIVKDNIFAVQFHPEKSDLSGMNILKSFYDYKKLQKY